MPLPRRLLPILLALTASALALPATASAGVANAGLPGASPTNPLVAPGMPWGRFYSPTKDAGVDPPSAYFNTASSPVERLELGRIVATPRFRWFGSWIQQNDVGYRATYKPGVYTTARNYIEAVRDATGNRDALVPIGIFRLEPFERHVGDYIPSSRDVANYRLWIRTFARAIRDAHARVALLLQPDLPVALDRPAGANLSRRQFRRATALDLGLIKWTAAQFDALPYTSVYIDAGASDWVPVPKIAHMLRLAGIGHARGFSLNVTHYETDAHNLAYGDAVVRNLARHGYPGKHFVEATGMNGRPFSFQKVSKDYRMDPPVCGSATARACVTLGRPPSADTGDPTADAFLWTSRPWINNATRRTREELLQIIRTSPFHAMLATVSNL